MKSIIEQDESVKSLLEVLDEQARTLALTAWKIKSPTTTWPLHTSIERSTTILHDRTNVRVAAAISSQLKSGLTVDHVLDLKTGALGMGAFTTDMLNDKQKPVIRGSDNLAQTNITFPKQLDWFIPLFLMTRFGLLKMETLFGPGSVIIGVDEKTITVLEKGVIKKFELKDIGKASSTISINDKDYGELVSAIMIKTGVIRDGLLKTAQKTPITGTSVASRKGGNNNSRNGDSLT